MSDIKILTGPEVAKHNSRESCWIIVHGKVYDVTDFLDGKLSRSDSLIWNRDICLQSTLAAAELF